MPVCFFLFVCFFARCYINRSIDVRLIDQYLFVQGEKLQVRSGVLVGTEKRFCPVISESMVRLLGLKYLSRVLNCVYDTTALV